MIFDLRGVPGSQTDICDKYIKFAALCLLLST